MKKILFIVMILCSTSAWSQIGIINGFFGSIFNGKNSRGNVVKNQLEDIDRVREEELLKSASQREEAIKIAEEKKLQKDAEQAAALAESERLAEERSAKIKARKIQPDSFDDLLDLYENEGVDIGYDIAESPLVRPDKEIYAIDGKLRFYNSDSYFICETIPENGSLVGNYFAVKVSKNTKKDKDIYSYLRVNGFVAIVGRYVANIDYITVAKIKKMMPVFDAKYLLVPSSQ